MTRILSLLALTAAAVVPAAASAQQMNYYAATPVAAPAKARIVTRGTPWFTRGASVVAPKAPESAAKVCAMVAAKVGTLSAFSAGGQAFADADLATCNAAAAPAMASAPAAAETAAR